MSLDSGVRSKVDTGVMNSCCGSPDLVIATAAPLCPQSGTKGQAVDLLTVKALLCDSALRTVAEGPYRFCADPSCAVVYFNGAGQVFTTTDLRVPVWQKEPSNHRMICYCFNENESSLAQEFAQTGRCDASVRIRRHIAAGRCACEVRNPRGVCCLGDVMKAVARLQAECAMVLETYGNGISDQ